MADQAAPSVKSSSKKRPLRELQQEFFESRTKFFAEYSSNQQAYQDAIRRADEKRAKIKQDFEASIAALDHEVQLEVKDSKEHLSKLIPIDPAETPPPTTRAAYSDRMAALMAKLAFFAYVRFENPENREILERVLTDGGMVLRKTYDINNTEAYLAEAKDFLVVAFRGTSSKRDRMTDFDFKVKRIKIQGHPLDVCVHNGFYTAYQQIEAELRKDLLALAPEKPVYFCGHSLGGALAIVASAAVGVSDDQTLKPALTKLADRIAAVYSFGAPRVGDSNFDNIVKAPHYRVVNRFDLVTLAPPNWLLGYRHTGDVRLLRTPGEIPLRRASGSMTTAFNLIASLFLSATGQLKALERHHSISMYAAKLEEVAHFRSAWR